MRSLCANLKANDFREREGGIHTLVELSGDRPDLVGSNINGVRQLLGYFCGNCVTLVIPLHCFVAIVLLL